MPAKSSLVYRANTHEKIRKGSVSRGKSKRKPYSIPSQKTKGVFSVETKYLDSEKVLTILKTTVANSEFDPAIKDTFNAMTQGVGDSQRNGKQIVVKRLQINILLSLTGVSAQGQPSSARIVIYQDKMTAGTQKDAEDVLHEPTFVDSATLTFPVMGKDAEFRILYDQDHTMNLGAAVGDGTTNKTPGVIKVIHIDLPMNMQVNYSTPLGCVDDIVDNSLHMIAIQTRPASNALYINYVARLSFVG